MKTEGFGVLTRINFDEKIKEKIGKIIEPTVILGACNPTLAYEGFKMNTDITSLLPCNVVVRDVGHGKISIEVAKPSAMMQILGNQTLISLSQNADQTLARALEKI